VKSVEPTHLGPLLSHVIVALLPLFFFFLGGGGGGGGGGGVLVVALVCPGGEITKWVWPHYAVTAPRH
jgi:hypothetical protein